MMRIYEVGAAIQGSYVQGHGGRVQFVVCADAPALLALVGHHRPLQHSEACPYCRHPRPTWLGPDAVPVTDLITEFPRAIVPLLSPANVVYDGLHCCAAVLSSLFHCVHLYFRQWDLLEDKLSEHIASVVDDGPRNQCIIRRQSVHLVCKVGEL